MQAALPDADMLNADPQAVTAGMHDEVPAAEGTEPEVTEPVSIAEQIALCRQVLTDTDERTARQVASILDEAVPESVEQLHALTALYKDIGSLGWGVVFAQRYLVGRETDPEAILLLAGAFYAAKFFQDACVTARLAISTPGLTIETLRQVNDIFVKSMAWGEAVSVLRVMLDMIPGDVPTMINIVRFIGLADGAEAARADLLPIRALLATRPELYPVVGNLAFDVGLFKEARSDFEHALKRVVASDLTFCFELIRLAGSLKEYTTVRRFLPTIDVDGFGNWHTWETIFRMGAAHLLPDVTRVAARRCLQLDHGYLPAVEFQKTDAFRKTFEVAVAPPDVLRSSSGLFRRLFPHKRGRLPD
jgi:hypothetical protein